MRRIFCNLSLFIATALLLHSGMAVGKDIDWVSLNPELKGATFVNDSGKCMECHEEYIRTFAMTKMGRNLPNGGCESCHGPMSKHIDAPRQEPPIVVSFTKKNGHLTPAQKSSVCTQCHQDGIQMNWATSAHANAENTCTTCHNIMAVDDPVLTKTTQPQVCFQCHQDKRAKMNRVSRHPVREGKVVCSDCHNPHGGPGPMQLAKNTINEVCYQCHADKRGPFLWEHEPVRENCTLCHDPHGSTQPRMLKVRMPFLCQECHQLGGGHPSQLYDGSAVAPPGSNRSRYVLANSCANCHPQVHGSNHPSGVRFQR